MRLATIGLVSSIALASLACGSSPEAPRAAPVAATARTLAVFSASATAKQKLGVDKWVIWVTAKGTLVYEGVDAKRHHVSHLSFRVARDAAGARTYNLGWQSVPAKQQGVARFRSDRSAIVDAMPSAVVKWTQLAQKDLAAFKKRGGKLSYGCAADVLTTMAGMLGALATCNPISEVLSLGTAALGCGASVLGIAAGAVGVYEDCFPQSSSSPSSPGSSGDQGGGTTGGGLDTGSSAPGEDNGGGGTGDEPSTDTGADTAGGGDPGGDPSDGEAGGDTSVDTGADTGGDPGGDTGGGDTGGDTGGAEDPGADYGGDSGGESFDV
jgi:hypothetical protein